MMKLHEVRRAAAQATSARPDRPATALIHDSADARLVVFRIEAGQIVTPHTSTSTVILSVVAGTGIVSGGSEEHEVSAGDVVLFDPNELHGMRATNDTLIIVATIAPRPGGV